jgi:L-amino acid N-acyltransferase YncA
MSPVIRLATEHDAAQLQAIYAPNVCDTAISFELVPPTVDEMRQRIRKTLEQLPWVVCEHQGEVLGYAYASAHRARGAYQWSVDVSVYIHPSSRRSGVGRAVYSSLFKILEIQGFYNAYAGITLPNPASVGLHEAMGFQPVGVYRDVGYKLGAWHDVGWWQLALRERSSPPMPPSDLGMMRTSAQWEIALATGLPLLRL